MSLVENLSWRYATKRMTGEKINDEQLNAVLDATRLSASSFGLQPYTILVVSNQELKEKLQPAAYNQPQITESSHLLVFTIWDNISKDHVQGYINDIAAKRGVPVNVLDGFRDTIQGTVDRLGVDQQNIWASKQAYIALGTALAAAAEQKIDATPMEGFDPAAFDELLGLKEKGLKSVVILALGKRSEEDTLSKAPKVRRAKEELFRFVA